MPLRRVKLLADIRGIRQTMFCNRCGAEIEKTTRICPICGNLITYQQAGKTTASSNYPRPRQNSISPYESGYTERTTAPEQAPDNMSASSPYTSSSSATATPPHYQNVPPFQNPPPIYTANAQSYTITQKNDNALVVEIILSLFGIFGVGWLMAGETTTGIILLICSFCIYWPLIFLGTLFTFGLGLLCLGPLAISAIIINIVLLNQTLKKKATRFIIHQPPDRTAPPWH